MGKISKRRAARDEGKRGFKANSKEGKFLARLIKNKEISPGITPGALKELHPVFNEFKNNSFASGLRRMKNKFGVNVRGGTGKSVEFGSVLFDVLLLLTPSARFLLSLLDDEAEEDDEEEEELQEDVLENDDNDEAMDAEDDRKPPPTAPCVSVASPSTFPPSMSTWNRVSWMPNVIKGMFQDAVSLVWHQVLIIQLPSGVGWVSTDDIDLTTESNGWVLGVEVCFPDWISSQQFLYFLKKALLEQAKLRWKELSPAAKDQAEDQFRDSYACMSASLKTQMALMREKPGVHTIKATAKIKLDVAVKPITPEDWHMIGDDTGVRLLYVDLKSPTETSYEAKPVKELLLSSKEAK